MVLKNWMRLLRVVFGSPAEFLACYSTRLGAGALFCPTRTQFAAGDHLLLDLGFPGLTGRTFLRGEAHTAGDGLGGWVRLDRTESRAHRFLLALARGDSPDEPIVRCHIRMPVALPVDCRVDEIDEPDGDRLIGRTHDIGGGGVFIVSDSPPAVGTRVRVVLGPTFDLGERFSLDGRVAWIGLHEGERGFAVRFDRGGVEAQRLRITLRRACETGRVEFAV